MTGQTRYANPPGMRLLTQFSREQRGWMAMALVAFLGVVYVGPAVTAAAARGRRLRIAAGARVRRLGGPALTRLYGRR